MALQWNFPLGQPPTGCGFLLLTFLRKEAAYFPLPLSHSEGWNADRSAGEWTSRSMGTRSLEMLEQQRKGPDNLSLDKLLTNLNSLLPLYCCCREKDIVWHYHSVQFLQKDPQYLAGFFIKREVSYLASLWLLLAPQLISCSITFHI